MSLSKSASKIIAAAVVCFAKQGSEVTIAEIAKAAGVTSRTLFRAFPGRRALVEAVAVSRLDWILEQLRPRIEKEVHLADALVTGFLEFTQLARADPVFLAALNEASDWQLERFMVGPNEKFFSRADALWRDTFALAMKANELTPNLDPMLVNAWLRSVAVILLLRDDLDRDGQEQLLRNFVLPALVVAGRRV